MLSRTWKDAFNDIFKYAQQAFVELKGKTSVFMYALILLSEINVIFNGSTP